MKYTSVPLVGGFYADETRAWSSQDVVNWLPTQAEKNGTRTPSMLKTPPGLREFAVNYPVTFATFEPMTLPDTMTLSTDWSTLTNNTGSSVNGAVFGTQPIVGPTYFEMQVDTTGTIDAASAGIGASDYDRRAAMLGAGTGNCLAVQCPGGAVVNQNVTLGTLDAGVLGPSMRIRFAVNGRNVWVGAVGQTGWVGGGNPSSGTSPTYVLLGTSRLFPAASIAINSGSSVEYISNQTGFLGSVPGSFVAGMWVVTDTHGFATLDPNATSALYALSNGNLTATNIDAHVYVAWTACSRVKRSGKPYWEVHALSGVISQPRAVWGICQEGEDYLQWFLSTNFIRGYAIASDGTKYVGNVSSALTSGINTGDIIRNRFDIGTGLYEVAINAGAWMTIASGITGPGWRVAMTTYEGTFYPEGGTFNFGATPFAYTVPTGYEAGWLA